MKYKLFLFFIFFLFSCKKNDNKNHINYNIGEINLSQSKNNEIKNGKNIFNGSCATCHLYGTGGSTVVNDKKYWQNLIDKKPLNKIYNNVIIGFTGKKGIMPKRGGCIKCSDQDLIDAVNYIFLYNGIRINN
tara:strand:+ start:175 stop:570 length:396 start_codon:yes stop_codon:yes gene_type:complete